MIKLQLVTLFIENIPLTIKQLRVMCQEKLVTNFDGFQGRK